MNIEDIRSDLIALLGEKKVISTKAALDSHAGDKWFASHSPDVVFLVMA